MDLLTSLYMQCQNWWTVCSDEVHPAQISVLLVMVASTVTFLPECTFPPQMCLSTLCTFLRNSTFWVTCTLVSECTFLPKCTFSPNCTFFSSSTFLPLSFHLGDNVCFEITPCSPGNGQRRAEAKRGRARCGNVRPGQWQAVATGAGSPRRGLCLLGFYSVWHVVFALFCRIFAFLVIHNLWHSAGMGHLNKKIWFMKMWRIPCRTG